MKEVLKEIHKEAYISSKSLKILYEIKSDLIFHSGFLKSFQCSFCEAEMLEFSNNKFSCNICDNIEILTTPKPYYDFDFKILVKTLKNGLNILKKELESLKNFHIENDKGGENLAFDNIFKLDLCFFKNNDEFKNFEKEDRYYIVFTPFQDTQSEERIFFIDIYKFLIFDDLTGKVDINQNMFLHTVCNSLYKIFLKMNEEINSKSSNFYVKSALEAFAVCGATSENITKYKEVSGIEIFKNEVKKEIPYASKHEIQAVWNKIIKPKLENL